MTATITEYNHSTDDSEHKSNDKFNNYVMVLLDSEHRYEIAKDTSESRVQAIRICFPPPSCFRLHGLRLCLGV